MKVDLTLPDSCPSLMGDSNTGVVHYPAGGA